MSDATISPPPAGDGRGGPLSFSLEVRGGRTGFRRRPILGDRFLIGSDPVCDLRLDGRLAAPLHCLLRRDGDRLEAERLAAAPIITVNGAPVEHAALAAGDVLGVGPIRLVIHALAVRFDVVRPADDLVSDASAGTPLAARTAGDLVDLIEAEADRVREFDDRRSAGAAALLDALRRTTRPAAADAQGTAVTPDAGRPPSRRAA